MAGTGRADLQLGLYGLGVEKAPFFFPLFLSAGSTGPGCFSGLDAGGSFLAAGGGAAAFFWGAGVLPLEADGAHNARRGFVR